MEFKPYTGEIVPLEEQEESQSPQEFKPYEGEVIPLDKSEQQFVPYDGEIIPNEPERASFTEGLFGSLGDTVDVADVGFHLYGIVI